MEFEWDEAKAEANLQKHGIDFEDAVRIFVGPVLETRSARQGERRIKAVGVMGGVEIAIVYTRRAGRLRIISARRARINEREAYHQAHPGREA